MNRGYQIRVVWNGRECTVGRSGFTGEFGESRFRVLCWVSASISGLGAARVTSCVLVEQSPGRWWGQKPGCKRTSFPQPGVAVQNELGGPVYDSCRAVRSGPGCR